MVIEIVIILVSIAILWLLLPYQWYIADFDVDNKGMIQNNLIIYWKDDLRLSSYNNRNNKTVKNIWELGETLNNFKYISGEKPTNFLQLDIEKMQWDFTVSLSSPCKVTGIVFKENQTSYDVQFTQSLNKYTIANPNNTSWGGGRAYGDSRETLSLTDDAFKNSFEGKEGQNKAFYFHANKELPIRQITFSSNGQEVKDRTILMFLEPVEKGGSVVKRNEDGYAIAWTAKVWEDDWLWFKETAKNVYWKKDKLEHKEVRYIIATGRDTKLALRNFLVSKSLKTYGATTAESRIIVNHMSPLMFYINEYQDVDGWPNSWGLQEGKEE